MRKGTVSRAHNALGITPSLRSGWDAPFEAQDKLKHAPTTAAGAGRAGRLKAAATLLGGGFFCAAFAQEGALF